MVGTACCTRARFGITRNVRRLRTVIVDGVQKAANMARKQATCPLAAKTTIQQRCARANVTVQRHRGTPLFSPAAAERAATSTLARYGPRIVSRGRPWPGSASAAATMRATIATHAS
eukprot:76297-Chlamydomonas_euryale.AAC.12